MSVYIVATCDENIIAASLFSTMLVVNSPLLFFDVKRFRFLDLCVHTAGQAQRICEISYLYQSAGLPEKNIIGVPCSTASRHLLAMHRPPVASLATRVTEQVMLPQTDFQPA